MDYRNHSRKLLVSAKSKLACCNHEDIAYVALDLRMALECLIYEKVGLYKEEIPKIDLETWQPPQLLKTMLEVDPLADKSSTFSMKREGEGMEDQPYRYLGTENQLGLKDLKHYYNRLGL